MLKAVAFDMDDTLLSINLSAFCYVFLKDEVSLLGLVARKSPLMFLAPFSQAYLAMFDARRTDDLTNGAYFAREIERRMGVPLSDPVIADVLTCYEETLLPTRNDRVINARPRTGAHAAVEKVLDRGYRIALLTNPSFSEACIRARMAWGRLTDLPFELITTMDNSTRCKPDARYYLESLGKLGLKPAEVLMVGNDRKRDFVEGIGLQTAYVGAGTQDRALWNGSMEEFAAHFDEVVDRFESRSA